MLRGFFLVCLFWLPASALAEPVRIALFNTELHRKGPGLLLRDIVSGEDPQVEGIAALIAGADADAIVLLRFDWDADGAALRAFADRVALAGRRYTHSFAARPNTGRDTGIDLDGDGRARGPQDAQGYGLFAGHNGMAILSDLPIAADAVRDFSALPWRDLPGARLPRHPDGRPFPSEAAQSVQRLASVAHWDVPLVLPDGSRLHLLAFHASPPVFDGPEDANGLRNADELRLWMRYLDGQLTAPPPDAPVVVIGGANVDPRRGEGDRATLRDLLAHPRLRDPEPKGSAPVPEATVDWTGVADPPHLRVSYILPDRALGVIGSGIVWPAPEERSEMSRHGLVWVDLALP